MPSSRWFVVAWLILIFAIQISPLKAHANLSEAVPAPNTSLDRSPDEVRLRFTEPLEMLQSRITILNSNGEVAQEIIAFSDPDDAHQMFSRLDPLPDGVYTVAWRALSAADGHLTQGSFAFGVRAVVAASSSEQEISEQGIDEGIALPGVLVRWSSFLALALFLGTVAFWVLALPAGEAVQWPEFRFILSRLMGIGWVSMGIASVLRLFWQVAVAMPEQEVLASMGDTLLQTRFGLLWLAGMGLWLLAGPGWVVFYRTGREFLIGWVFILGSAISVTASLHSHASAAPDSAFAIMMDWLHRWSAMLWAGGLFILLLYAGLKLRRRNRLSSAFNRGEMGQSETLFVAEIMLARFSGYARMLVMMLLITGIYAAWLHVGSLSALIQTVYGRLLILKIILIVPLIGLGGYNLFLTRRLNGDMTGLWSGRLRRLVGIEVLLVILIFLAVGGMSQGRPARGIQDLRTLQAVMAEPQIVYAMTDTPDLHIHLAISPGSAGENTFVLSLINRADGSLDTSATRIRMRFEHLTEDIGQSEARPELQANGTYVITTTHLSLPGAWRIRTTIQRAEQFDTVVDLPVTVSEDSAGISPADGTISIQDRMAASMGVSVLLCLSGLVFLFAGRLPGNRRRLKRDQVLPLMMAGAGLLGLVMTAGLARQAGAGLTVHSAWMLTAPQSGTAALYLTIDNATVWGEQLVTIETDEARRIEVHQTQIVDDLARMRPIQLLDIPAMSQVMFTPGGYHIMVIDLYEAVEAGDTLTVRLRFASGLIYEVGVPALNEPPALP